jgi:hypothetical protein
VFDEVAAVAIQVLEYSHRAVWLGTRRLHESHASRPHPLVVSCEVVRVQEQEDPSARLVADSSSLFVGGGTGEKQACIRSWRRNDYPPLAMTERRIFEDLEPESVHIEGNRLVVLADDKGHKAQAGHSSIMTRQPRLKLSVSLSKQGRRWAHAR